MTDSQTIATAPLAPVRAQPQSRASYKVLCPITTRWSDNDMYGHVNNVVYYSWFDTAVNAYLIQQGVLQLGHADIIGLVVETQCNYFASVAYPEPVEVGLRVASLGRSSVRYELGVFANGSALSAAAGHFVHVYVDARTRKPQPVPEAWRAALQPLCV